MATLPSSTNLGRVELRVNNHQEISNFYQDILGLSVISSNDETTVLGVAEQPFLVIREDTTAQVRQPSETGLFHFAIKVPTRSALADALARIQVQWELEGASDHLVSEALYVSDPEGNGVEIYRDRKQEQWPLTENGLVQMDTRPLDLDDLRACQENNDSMVAGTTVGHVHLEVSSLEAARDFYIDAIGMRVRQQLGDAALFVAIADYHHHIGLNTWNHRTEPATGRGLAWFELIVQEQSTLDTLQTRILNQGYETRPLDQGFAATDADGITVRFRTPA